MVLNVVSAGDFDCVRRP
ncbi:hypothetical protein [Escherichia coli]|nr:hypothetical protein [Escherichia coli]